MQELNDGTPSLSGNRRLDESDEHSTVLREDLKERHVNMIAFSACLGIGLFLQGGKVIYLCGPGLAIFAYLLTGSIVWATAASLGEMTALLPVKGPIFEFPRRFVDEAVGYAAGWLTWFSWVVIIAAELLAVTRLWDFEFKSDYLESLDYPRGTSLGWAVGQKTSAAVWVFIFLLAIGVINLFPVRYYGRLEYFFGCIKMFFIVGLIMFNIIINARKVGHTSRFWTYESPYGFASQNMTLRNTTLEDVPNSQPLIADGGVGRLAAMWSAMTTIIFSVIGFETVAITAAENRDLTKEETVKIATRKISLRIILLYTLAVFTVGLNVPYTDDNLSDLAINSINGGQNSVFILAAVRNHIRGWPHFFNGFFIFSATTAGINALYNSSRILHALASTEEVWPKIQPFQAIQRRLERTWKGVPYVAVFASWLFGLLAFLAAKPQPAKILGQLAINSAVSMLIVYVVVCASFLQFYHCVNDAAKGRGRDAPNTMSGKEPYRRDGRLYPYKSHGQWLRAAYGLVGCSLLAIFNGWRSFVRPMSVSDFIASYIGFVVFFVLCALYKFKSQGFRWRRDAGKQLKDPGPLVVQTASKYRRGVLKFEDGEGLFSRTNLARLAQWIWVWIK